MAKKTKKPLLNEGTVRRMMKLADMDALGEGFISHNYSPISEVEEEEEEQEEIEDIPVDDSPEDDFPPTEPEEEFEEEAPEINISTEDAEDIIKLADKLKDAIEEEGPVDDEAELGGELGGEPPLDIDVASDDDLEEPGKREVYEEDTGLYEAALKGMGLELVDDISEAKNNQLKEAIYKRVVSRLLKETKK
tara:strand:+ start:623 stop:1198 length:576 start_codon:yes stop_codon:yes gene_type:complete